MDAKLSTVLPFLSAIVSTTLAQAIEGSADPTPEPENDTNTVSKNDDSTAYNIENDFGTANESKMPEIFLLMPMLFSL